MDDADIHEWIKPRRGPEGIAQSVREMYDAFLDVGFSVDQAFSLAKDFFNVMLDVVEEAYEQEQDDG